VGGHIGSRELDAIAGTVTVHQKAHKPFISRLHDNLPNEGGFKVPISTGTWNVIDSIDSCDKTARQQAPLAGMVGSDTTQ
jgi:hypothetical protein